MDSIAYTVTAEFADVATRDEFVQWLRDGHVDAVIRAGAHSATIVVPDDSDPGSPIFVETRYIFPTRGVYEAYIQRHAPELRADGLRRFPPSRGIAYKRWVGKVF